VYVDKIIIFLFYWNLTFVYYGKLFWKWWFAAST